MSEKVQKIKQEIERKIEICEKYSQLNLTESTNIGNHAQLLELREIRDFIDSLSEEPDWQSFRNKVAGDILCAMVPKSNNIISPGIVEYSIMIADELIKQLKEKDVETIDKKQCIQELIPKYKIGDSIEYRGEMYKITNVTVTDNNFYYDVSLIKEPSDLEEVVTSIGMAAEEQMFKIEQNLILSEEDERIRKELIRDIDIAMPIETAQKYIAWLKKQGEQKPIMIQWTGDNLKELVHFTGKSPKFEEWFKTWEDFENYVHTHNNIFKIFNEDGSHVEVPVGAWIIKAPDGYNVASRYVFKQKPNDKIEPKFNVGDWITNGEYIWKVTDIKPLDYLLQAQNGDVVGDTISYVDEEFHLWTIEDAKDGDVLVAHECYVIFKEIDGLNIRCYCTYHYLNSESFYIDTLQNKTAFNPAAKEQCDLLFQKMKEAGYVWYAEKKELRKIEQTSTWSKEDEQMIRSICCYLNEFGNWLSDKNNEKSQSIYKACDWLKSIKPNFWKPSEKQMEALRNLLSGSFSMDNSKTYQSIDSLYNDIKKL